MNGSQGKIQALKAAGLINEPLSPENEAALEQALQTMSLGDITSLSNHAKTLRKDVNDKDPNLINCFVPL